MIEHDTPYMNTLSTRKYIGFFGMIIGMFMSILDIQIVASSLPVIASGLSASQEELSWVQTSYIIAEVIVIPLTGFFSKLLSTRIAFCVAATGFTIMSIICALSNSLESMIIARFFQGMFGGAMIPTVFGIIYIIFEPKERSVVVIIIGLVVTVAPTLGPTLGGYITDILSWHFMFLLNLIPGICSVILVFIYADFDKPNIKVMNNFDYIGAFLLITSLGCFQYILEEGGRKDWFENSLISVLSLYVATSFVLLIYHELTTQNPILDLFALKNRNFAVGCILSGMLGVGLYGSVFLLPIFLSAAGLNTIQIGIIMVITGISQFISAPFAGACAKHGVDKRLMMVFGISMFGFGCYLNSFMTFESRFYELAFPQFVRGFALMFCFVPINDISLGTLPTHQVQDASGLYNLMRNLGGAFGLAIINYKLNKHAIICSDILSSNLSATSELGQNHLEHLSSMLNINQADQYASAIYMTQKILLREGFTIAINNMFAYIGLMYIFALILIPLTKDTQNVQSNAH